MMQHTQHIRIKDHLLDLVQLPEAAQEELVEFMNSSSINTSSKPRRTP